jgi:hypothetical protein
MHKEIDMRDIIKTTLDMEKEKIGIQMVKNMKDNSLKVTKMVLEFITTLMEIAMKDIGRWINVKVMVNKFMQMELIIKENGNRIKKMALEFYTL